MAGNNVPKGNAKKARPDKKAKPAKEKKVIDRTKWHMKIEDSERSPDPNVVDKVYLEPYFDVDPLKHCTEGDKGVKEWPEWIKTFDCHNVTPETIAISLFGRDKTVYGTIYHNKPGGGKNYPEYIAAQASDDLVFWILPEILEPMGVFTTPMTNHPVLASITSRYNKDVFTNNTSTEVLDEAQREEMDTVTVETMDKHSAYEHRAGRKYHLYSRCCSNICGAKIPANPQFCSIAYINLLVCTPTEVSESLKTSRYYQFEKRSDQPNEYRPKEFKCKDKNLAKYEEWPPIPVGDPTKGFLDHDKFAPSSLLQVKCVVERVNPHSRGCSQSMRCHQTWVMDMENGGSGTLPLEFPINSIFKDVYNKYVSEVSSRSKTNGVGFRITNGYNDYVPNSEGENVSLDYPYDNRCQLPFPPPFNAPQREQKLVDPMDHFFAMVRFTFWLINNLDCPSEFTSRHLEMGQVYPPVLTKDLDPVHLYLKDAVGLQGGHAVGKNVGKKDPVPQVFHSDFHGFRKSDLESESSDEESDDDDGDLKPKAKSNDDEDMDEHLPVWSHPKLKNCTKPGSILVPISQEGRNLLFPLGFGYPDRHRRINVEYGSALFIQGDTVHCGDIIPADKVNKIGARNRPVWNPAFHCYLDSYYIHRITSKIAITTDINVIRKEHLRDIARIGQYTHDILSPIWPKLKAVASCGVEAIKNRMLKDLQAVNIILFQDHAPEEPGTSHHETSSSEEDHVPSAAKAATSGFSIPGTETVSADPKAAEIANTGSVNADPTAGEEVTTDPEAVEKVTTGTATANPTAAGKKNNDPKAAEKATTATNTADLEEAAKDASGKGVTPSLTPRAASATGVASALSVHTHAFGEEEFKRFLDDPNAHPPPGFTPEKDWSCTESLGDETLEKRYKSLLHKKNVAKKKLMTKEGKDLKKLEALKMGRTRKKAFLESIRGKPKLTTDEFNSIAAANTPPPPATMMAPGRHRLQIGGGVVSGAVKKRNQSEDDEEYDDSPDSSDNRKRRRTEEDEDYEQEEESPDSQPQKSTRRIQRKSARRCR